MRERSAGNIMFLFGVEVLDLSRVVGMYLKMDLPVSNCCKLADAISYYDISFSSIIFLRDAPKSPKPSTWANLSIRKSTSRSMLHELINMAVQI
jgi:hypothetical protein